MATWPLFIIAFTTFIPDQFQPFKEKGVMALGSQCLWFLVVWFWIWERECWNWGGIGLKHLTCQSVKKKTFPSFASNFSLNKNNLKWVAKMNVTPNTRGGANNGKLYWKLFTLLVHSFFKTFNGDTQHDNFKPKNKMVIRSKSPVTVGCVFGSK